MWGRVENGVVVEFSDTDPAGLYHPDIEWVALPPQLADFKGVPWRVVDGALVPVDWDDLRRAAAEKADATAELIRLRTVTPGSAQAMVYQAKSAEARGLLAGGAGPFPHLAAEVGITAETMEDVAATVLAMEAAWQAVSAAIERARLKCKAQIKAAATVADILSALDSAEWPT